MDWFLRVILGKALDLDVILAVAGPEANLAYLAPVSACSLTRQEGQRPMTGCFVFSVRHLECLWIIIKLKAKKVDYEMYRYRV